MSEIWHMVLANLADDARASVRLMRAVKDLYFSSTHDAKYWKNLEFSLRTTHSYEMFCRYIGHLGVRGRILVWTGFCDASCFACKADLFGICCNTFAINKKYCSGCKNTHMVSELQLSRRIPISWIASMRTQLRHAWMPSSAVQKHRYYSRSDVNRYLEHTAIAF